MRLLAQGLSLNSSLGVAFVMFMGHTDFHMIKVRAGQIYAVHAILSAASGPGWP